jgi:hypothetical protein
VVPACCDNLELVLSQEQTKAIFSTAKQTANCSFCNSEIPDEVRRRDLDMHLVWNLDLKAQTCTLSNLVV